MESSSDEETHQSEEDRDTTLMTDKKFSCQEDRCVDESGDSRVGECSGGKTEGTNSALPELSVDEALEWANELLARKADERVQLERERELMVAQYERARQGIRIAHENATALAENQCNELMAQTSVIRTEHITATTEHCAELQSSMEEMRVCQQMMNTLLNGAASGQIHDAMVCHYAPILLDGIQAAYERTTRATEASRALRAQTIQFVPSNVTPDVGFLGTLTVSETSVAPELPLPL